MRNETPRYPLVIFDMDGVLTDHISSWMFVHNHFGVDNEDGYEDYRQGRIDDLEFMSRDIKLWKKKKPDITCQEVREILNEVPLMPGTKETFRSLRQKGMRTAIISGGLEQLAERLQSELEIDYIRSNGLETEGDGMLTGEGILRVPLRSKEEVVREVTSTAGVPPDRTAAVGDTGIDAGMLRMCGLGIAFDPKDYKTRNCADVVIHNKDLREILKFIL